MEQMNDTWHPENFRQPHSRKERGNIATKGSPYLCNHE